MHRSRKSRAWSPFRSRKAVFFEQVSPCALVADMGGQRCKGNRRMAVCHPCTTTNRLVAMWSRWHRTVIIAYQDKYTKIGIPTYGHLAHTSPGKDSENWSKGSRVPRIISWSRLRSPDGIITCSLFSVLRHTRGKAFTGNTREELITWIQSVSRIIKASRHQDIKTGQRGSSRLVLSIHGGSSGSIPPSTRLV